jgi:xylose isomerase
MMDGHGNLMKKTIQEKINEAYEELKEIALELADDLEISQEIDGNYACFIDKEIYTTFQKMNEKINKLHEKQKEQDAKQLKFALKR